ncbi:Ig-like domain-containing protein [Paenibacillus sp. TAB 01]|uniref:Ig-like domain-containing protein n=1 Tax=Paenibacillus sp. TAB 01 TaxID=3368988 RepID=UPI0037534BF4
MIGTIISSCKRRSAACALIALLLSLTTAFPSQVRAASLPNAVMTPVSSNVGWIAAPIAVADDSFMFDARAHFQQLTDTPVNISAASDNPSIADATTTGSAIRVQVKTTGTMRLAVTGTGASSSVLTDNLEMKVTLLGDTNGDGILTSADVQYIYKVVNSKLATSDEEKNRLDINRDGQVTSADAALLMSSYVGKTPVSGGVKFLVSLTDRNDAPKAEQTSITGAIQTGQTLLGNYRYLDPENDNEGTSAYQWYRGWQENGSDKTAISGAVSVQYQVQEEDIDQYLFFEVTPTDAKGMAGTSTAAITSGKVLDKTAPTIISMTPENNATGVDINTTLQAKFSEPVQAVEGKSVRIRRLADNSIMKTYTANDISSVLVSGSNVSFLNASLESETTYYMDIDAGAFKDTAGNNFAGLSDSSLWSFSTPDTIAPTTQAMLPANLAVAADKAANFTLTFSEPVVAAPGKTVNVYNKADDSVKLSYAAGNTTEVEINGSTVTIINPGLDEKSSYYVTVEAGAFTDRSGNPFAGLSGKGDWTFTVPDKTAPVIVSSTPADDAVGVNRLADMTIKFSEPIQAVTGKSIQIYRSADDSLLKTYNVTDSNEVSVTGADVTLKSPNLDDGVGFYVVIDAGAFKDMAGNDFAGLTDSSAWSFSTPDTVAPTLQAILPANLAVDADKAGDLTLTFSEPVIAAAGKTVTVYDKADDSVAFTYAADNTTNVKINGATVTIKNSGLDEKSSYYVTVEAGAFTDRSGNPFAGLSGKGDWTFTVPDKTAPIIVSSTPADDAVGVDRLADMMIKFSEPVQAISGGSIQIYRSLDDSLLKTYNVTDSSEVSVTLADVTLKNPNLDDGASFYVKIDAGAFKDMAGNDFTGLSSSVAWSFTTLDTMPPSVVSTIPADNATRIDWNADLKVTFSEPVWAVNGKTITIRNTVNSSVYMSYTLGTDPEVSVNGKVLTIQHSAFEALSSYYVEIEAGALKDAADHSYVGMSGSDTWNFETKDLRELTVSPSAPLNEVNLASGTTLTLDLMDDSFKNQDLTGYIQLNHAPTGLTVAGAVYNDAHTVTITFNFNGTDFDSDISDFSVTVLPSALDSGRAITSNQLTIQAIVEPTVVSTTPNNNAQGINSSASLSMIFDRDVSAVAGKKITIYRKSDDKVIQAIDAGNTSLVTISGNTVTVGHTALSNGTEYYVLLQGGAFEDASHIGSEPIAAKTAWSFMTVKVPDMFFSEFLRGSGSHQVAIELYYPSGAPMNPAPSKTFSVFAYQYNTSTSSMEITEIKIQAQAYKTVPLIIIDGAFYDFMDITTTASFSSGYQYFNQDDVIYDLPPLVLKALVLKEGDQVLDVIGDPTATGPGSFLSSGGTLVRKSGVVGGVTLYDPSQWDVYPVDTFTKIGNHTP